VLLVASKFIRQFEITHNMKFNTLTRSLFLGAALSTSSLFANQVWIENTDNDGNLSGGEFIAHTDTGSSFLTFCLEHEVDVNANVWYDYTISDSAISGGTNLHGAGPGDAISKGTAWLFEQFYFGTLVDTDGVGSYFDAGTHSGLTARDYNAGQLQNAFWMLEDAPPPPPSNYYLNLATTYFTGLGQDAFSDAGPGSRVKAMNLTVIATGADAQSQLVFVPDSGMTVALLGLGLLSLAAFRRKL